MTHFLESDRLYLKGIELSDLKQRYVDWMNDPEISQYMETWHFPHTRENIAKYITNHSDDRNEPFFGIFLKEARQDELVWDGYNYAPLSHIGNCKLGPINWVHRYADVSLFIGEKKLRGTGYATEVIQLLSDYAFKRLGLHKLKAGIYSNNVASISAFKKAGFQFEGELRDHVWFNGEWINVMLFGKLNV